MQPAPAFFEQHEIRRVYDEATETWWFSVVDILQVLIQQPDYQAARNYWKVLKNRLGKEGSQVVTNCNQLKFAAADGRLRLTDVATAETLLRLVQSVPSPKAEPIRKRWGQLSESGLMVSGPIASSCRWTWVTRIRSPWNSYRTRRGLTRISR